MTDEEFWTWCGLLRAYVTADELNWFDSNGDVISSVDESGNPIIDLNFLFKYAVPKLQDLGEIAFCRVAKGWRVFIITDSRVKKPCIKSCHSEDIHEDAAQALKEAISQAIQ